MGMKSEAPNPVQSVDRAAQILEMLSDESQLTISEISRRLQVHRSTAFRLLGTLEHHDLVEQDGSRGAYRLGFALLRMANSVTQRLDFSREAQACCDALAQELSETVNLAILDAGYAVTITQTVGDRMVGVARQYVGQRGPLHATSTGKMLLAHAGEPELERLVSRGLESFTGMTISDPEVLRAELEAIRGRGWSSAVAEWRRGSMRWRSLCAMLRGRSSPHCRRRRRPSGFPSLGSLSWPRCSVARRTPWGCCGRVNFYSRRAAPLVATAWSSVR